eukprot:gb/GECG01000967.1/.p1 GENE.gb/GECG01000967.1/~~gb/GECG01000967.1/.p1  ORF type:complete len:363 (+),score=62.90 gb/GECG01000967.1/:1-1089(+)
MGAQGSKPSLPMEEEEQSSQKDSANNNTSRGNANVSGSDGATKDNGGGASTGGSRKKKAAGSEEDFPPLVYYFYATLQMYIPIEDVRIVVGKARQTLTQLEEDLKVKIDVPKNRDPDTEGGSYWAPVVIRGECRSLWDCYQRISLLVDDVDDVVLSFPVMKERHPSLIGKNANTMKTIGADSGARIHVPPETEKEDRTITLEGEMDQVAHAFEMFANEVVKAATTKSTSVISSSDAHNVVGKGLSRVRQIERETGTHITVRFPDRTETKKDNKSKQTTFTITGGDDHVRFARLAIEDLLQSNRTSAKAIAHAQAEMRAKSLPVIMKEKDAYWLTPAYVNQQQVWLQEKQQRTRKEDGADKSG